MRLDEAGERCCRGNSSCGLRFVSVVCFGVAGILKAERGSSRECIRATPRAPLRSPNLPWRLATGPQTAVEFASQPDERTDEVTHGRLQVMEPKALQEDEGDEAGQDEVDNRGWVVFETMVQRPMRAERVEAVVFDIPAVMSRPPDLP